MFKKYIAGTKDIRLLDHPEKCPECHFATLPKILGDNLSEDTFSPDPEETTELYVFLECPRPNCKTCYSAKFTAKSQNGSIYDFEFYSIQTGTLEDVEFSEVINEISESFVEIYSQAHQAEQYGLEQICGVGYRKALEFLIKDYLIALDKGKADDIKKKFLGNCIQDHVENPNIKMVAERAVWLGNDETHYIRKWEGHTVDDLKGLINLTVKWIEMEILTKELEKKMPKTFRTS